MFQALCSISNIWNTIVDNYINGMEEETKKQVGIVMVVVALVLFAYSLKGAPKGQIVGSWVMFWLSAIIMSVSFLFLVY